MSQTRHANEIGRTIIQQMGGWGKIRMMTGAKSVKWLPKGVAFQWPSRHRSKGNYVEVAAQFR